jgi:hypothetical protein
MPEWQTFVGMKRAANCRLDAVASHQQIRFGPNVASRGDRSPPCTNAEQFPAMNLLASIRVMEELGRGDADGGQRVQKSKFDQHSHAVREHVDPNSQLTHRRR